MKTTCIDNGFLIVSAADAGKLANGKLPNHGCETLIAHDGSCYWLGRTRYASDIVWAIRPSNWRLVNGQAVL